ncbi:MAG: hypothetical protein ACT4OO_07670 [Nitrospiraceae bacterium]
MRKSSCAIRFCIIALLLDTSPILATQDQAESGQKDQKQSADRSGLLQPIRDVAKRLEKGISEEPPKAIKSKEGFSGTQDQGKDK